MPVWYRGESLNLEPAKPGEWIHDFADGLYFADTVAGAEPFARRSPNPAHQRLYQVNVDLDAMRVLNLSTDVRWTNYMNEVYVPTTGTTRIQFLRQMAVARYYNDMFTRFINANGINLNQYDAVIGPLIQHGGNQMCVLHKNGQPSDWAKQLRAAWKPLGAAITPATPKGMLRFTGKLGPGVKIVGGGLLALAINLFLQWLLGKFMESLIRSEINRQLGNLEPEVQAKIKTSRSQVLFILADGRKAFAELRFAVVSTTTPDFTPGGVGSIAGETGFPTVSLNDMQITDRALPKEGLADGTEMAVAGTYARTTTNYFKATVEINASNEEVSLFRSFLDEINWYNEQLALGPSNEDRARLTRDRDALQAKLDAALRD